VVALTMTAAEVSMDRSATVKEGPPELIPVITVPAEATRGLRSNRQMRNNVFIVTP
jgi:hypothetical protein